MKLFCLILANALTDFAVLAPTGRAVTRMNLWSTSDGKRIRLMAQHLFDSGVMEARLDRIDSHITVSKTVTAADLAEYNPYSNDKIELTIWKNKWEEPKLFLEASHSGSDWLFIQSVIFKIGFEHHNPSRPSPLPKVEDERRFTNTRSGQLKAKTCQVSSKELHGETRK